MDHEFELTPTQWILSVASTRPPVHRRFRDALRTRFHPSQLEDIWPDPDGVMRGHDGRPWIPTTEPTKRTGLFGRARRSDWTRHAVCAQAQAQALAHRAERLQLANTTTLITLEQAESWTGRIFHAGDHERLRDAIPHSSIPDAIETIATQWEV